MARQMKDSGIAWIGEIPETWDIAKVGYFFDIQLGKMLQPTQQSPDDVLGKYLCAANVGGNQLKYAPLKEMWFSPAELESLKVQKGDMLVVEGGDVASCDIVNDDVGELYFQNALHRVRPIADFDVRILKYWLWMTKGIGHIDLICNKATIAHFSKEKFIALPVVALSLSEQRRIAAFLDRRCAEIDAVMEHTKATIEEYKKLKQAVITEAVTKGVRGPRKMKDSGIEWIGEIPEGWAVRKLGRFISIRSGITLGKTYPQDAELVELPYLRVANVKADGFALDDVATIEVTPEEAEKYALKAGELLMTEGGDRDKLGRGTIWHGEIAPCLHQNHVFAATCDETWLLTQYLAYLTASNVGRQYFDITAKKTTNLACTNSNTILQFKIPLPSTEEQQEIIEWLPIRCAALDTLIARKTALLTELETYKKSLIYEYVTGKKEVI